MQIENSFTVGASPDAVYAFLLDVNRVVACVPGAELSEVVDADTFRGKVRIKVGPVTVSYNGTAHITSRDEATRTATLSAEGRETTGSGSARATTAMSVTPEGEGSAVRLATDFTVVGRVAQFGRGIMEEVSRRLVGQMADCIREKLEEEAGAPAAPSEPSPAPPRVQVSPEPPERSEPAPVDALALARSVAADRLRAAGPGRLAGVAVGLFAVYLLARRLRRRRG
ncbi:MAG TPA: SRPBCC family protein [Candidatus Dormibacteraeota bacterium]|nr:SRPBCC family protein [Candidatus Dormibacteraeota bacterium]